jgi:hypothetical protein
MIKEFEVNLIPKHHYFSILKKIGPLHDYSTMLFESFHCFFTQAAIQAIQIHLQQQNLQLAGKS